MADAPFQRTNNPGKYSVQAPVDYGKQETSIWAILALVCAFLMPVLGIIFAIVALVKINDNPSLKGKGLAIAGLVISLLWIPLMFLLFVGAIAYFGVLNPSNMLPTMCSFSMGLDCIGPPVADESFGTITFPMTNNLGQRITDIKVSSGCKGGVAEPITLEDGQTTSVTLTGCKFADYRYAEDVTILYTSSATGMTHSSIGSVRGQV
jgi:hypothetical protein